MNIAMDRKTYADAVGVEEELLDPLPSCALANGAAQISDFKTMLPYGVNRYYASYVIGTDTIVNGAFIRYGEFKPVLLPIVPGRWVLPEDTLGIILTQGTR